MYPIFMSRLIFYILSGAKKVFTASKNPLKTLCLLSGLLDESDITLRSWKSTVWQKIEENLLQTVISACSHDLTVTQKNFAFNIHTKK